MRRQGLAAAALGLVTAIAVAGVATGATADKDFVTGGGFSGNGTSHFSISAHNGPNGPSGHVDLKSTTGGAKTSGHVTCLRVVGNEARVVFQIEKGSDPDLVGQYRRVDLEDNGQPKGDPRDTIRAGLPRVAEITCADVESGDREILHGNINVNDR